MRIYEASVKYSLVRLGNEEALDCSEKVVAYMEGAFDDDPTVEFFYAVALNPKNFPIGRTLVTRGTASSSLVHPREAFKAALIAGATAVVFVHNHPSGDPAPSQADLKVTRALREAGNTLQINVLDHVIIGDKSVDPCGRGYYSFEESGLL